MKTLSIPAHFVMLGMGGAKATAQARRERELRELAEQGFPVTAISRWHYAIRDLHIWPASGRWQNARSGRHGKINDAPIGQLLRRELTVQDS